MPNTPLEEIRQAAARYLVESLGYPKDSLATDVSLDLEDNSPFVADLVVTQPDADPPLIVVGVHEPGSTPPQEVSDAIAGCGAQYYFWFDGFVDDPRLVQSWGTRYFERGDSGFATVPRIPHHGRDLRPRKRRPTSRRPCPDCGELLDQFCLVPCTDKCPGWSCPWFRLLHCAVCNKSFPRSKDPHAKVPPPDASVTGTK